MKNDIDTNTGALESRFRIVRAAMLKELRAAALSGRPVAHAGATCELVFALRGLRNAIVDIDADADDRLPPFSCEGDGPEVWIQFDADRIGYVDGAYRLTVDDCPDATDGTDENPPMSRTLGKVARAESRFAGRFV